MTYTVIGKDLSTGEVGIASTSCSINAPRVLPHVKGVLPELRDDGILISSQAFVNPNLSYKSFELLDDGASFEELDEELSTFDENYNFRQLGILKVSGESFVHTGEDTPPNHAHETGEGYLVMGNALSEDTVSAMDEAYQENEHEELAERLMLTLEAGRDAGGQIWQGEPIPELYSLIKVYDGEKPYPAVDFRIDFALNAVETLRRMLDNLRDHSDRYYEAFHETPEQVDENTLDWLWEVENNQIIE